MASSTVTHGQCLTESRRRLQYVVFMTVMASRGRWGHPKIFYFIWKGHFFSFINAPAALLQCINMTVHRRKMWSKRHPRLQQHRQQYHPPNLTNPQHMSRIPFSISGHQPRPRSIIVLYEEPNLAAAQQNSCKSRAAVRCSYNCQNLHLSPILIFTMSEKIQETEITLTAN